MFVKLIHQHADVLEKKTGVGSTMKDDNEVRQYLEIVIRETRTIRENRWKKDDRKVGA